MPILNLLSIRNPTANWWIDDHGLALMVRVSTVDITQNERTEDETATRLASGPPLWSAASVSNSVRSRVVVGVRRHRDQPSIRTAYVRPAPE